MFWLFVLLVLYLCIAGYYIPQWTNWRTAQYIAWGNVITAVLFSAYINQSAYVPAIRMLMLIVALLLAMKGVVYAIRKIKLSFLQWICFSCFWVGMDPQTFHAKKMRKSVPVRSFIVGVGNIIIGFGVLWLCHYLLQHKAPYYICWLLALVGTSMLFHFGLLTFLFVFWRTVGIPVKPLFNMPWQAENLSVFWGRRWNTAFVEMTGRSIYKPLVRKIGKAYALLATFMVSGLFHEIALTLPVCSGFGRPFAYFAIQGFLVLIEKRLLEKYPDWTKKYSRYWLFPALFLPLPLLFTPSFTREILFAIIQIS